MKTKLSILFVWLFLAGVKLNAELILYEYKLDEVKISAVSENKLNELQVEQREKLSNNSKLMTIRLEKGETLTINNKKIIKGNEESNPGGRTYSENGKFLMDVSYDDFAIDEKIEIYFDINNTRRWYEQRVASNYQYSTDLWPLEGPATIKIRITPYSLKYIWSGKPYEYHAPEQFFKISFKKSKSSQISINTNASVLVLPDGVSGSNLKLESSTDLVNWTEDSLGSKDSSDKKRFYRLRAVKE
jgi:hypothetical protein